MQRSLREPEQEPFKPWRSGDPYYHDIPRKGDPWEECFKLVQKFDDEMCRGWREEIDTLLVFAGLFSAAVTAFTVESYRWLQEDPVETSTRFLAQISVQLGNLALNNTSPTPISIPPPFSVPPSAIRINTFWFISLTLGLTAVLLGILCKQWLREYQRYEGLPPKDAFLVRQMRYEGLISWHVPKILSSLPLLLQAALLLFFGGLLDLLWSLNNVVASLVTAIVSITLLVLIMTTAFPCLQYLLRFCALGTTDEPSSQCAYKSPQSWAFHLVGTWLVGLYNHTKMEILGGTAINYLQLSLWVPDSNWVKYDMRWQSHGHYIKRGISWLDKTFTGNLDVTYHIYHCLESLEHSIAASCVAQVIEETFQSNHLFSLVGLILPTLQSFQQPDTHNDEDELVNKDIALTSYLVIHHRADLRISLRCVELCARIINTSIDDNTSAALGVLNVVLSGVPLSDELFRQLSTSVKSLFTQDRIMNDNVPLFWDTFNVLQQYSQENGTFDKSRPAFTLLEDVGLWLQRSMNSSLPLDDKQYRVMRCSKGMVDMYRSLQARGEVEEAKNTPEFVEVERLANQLDVFLELFGGTCSVFSPWGSDAWGLTREEFLNYKP